MDKYQFIVGMSVPALEVEINRLVSGDTDLHLRQVLFAQGTGFIAIVERTGEHPPPAEAPKKGKEKAAKSATS